MHANLVHACSVATALKKNLSKVTQPTTIIASLTSASEAIRSDLTATPANQVQVLTDLKNARDSVRLIVTTIDMLAKSLGKRKGGKGITFQEYRAQLNQIAADAQDATLLLDNSKVLIDKEVSRERQDSSKVSRTKTISFQEFIDHYVQNGDKDLGTNMSRLVKGMTSAELERLLSRRGPQFGEMQLHMSTPDMRICLEIARTESLGRGSADSDRKELDAALRARQGVEKLHAMENDYADVIAAVNVPEDGVRSVQVPLRVSFAGIPRLETLEKHGMKSEVFATEKFSNSSFVVHGQRLIVFRRSDAERHHREQVNTDRRTNTEIKQLRNLKARVRSIEKEIAELEEAKRKNRPAARKQIVDQIAEQQALLEDINKSIAAIEGSANAAKRVIKATDRRAKSSSDEMVFEYANHLLDMINERYSVPIAQVTGKMLHKVSGTNLDYVFMWVAPKHSVRELLSVVGKQGELVKSWTLAWK